VIGLDAAEATLLERWAEEGRLPTIERLSRAGAAVPLSSALDKLPGGIWTEIETGRSLGRIPFFYYPSHLFTGDAELRPIQPEDVDPETFFTTVASRYGCRVAVLDAPHGVPPRDQDGVFLAEWGVHDRHFPIRSSPAKLLDELSTRYGPYPVDWCDRHGEVEEGYRELLRDLLEGVRMKTAVACDLLRNEDWDLFVSVYSEAHCAGHQFWHFLDAGYPGHDPNGPENLKNAILSIYSAIDEGLDELVDAAGPGGITLVLASHGMGPYTGGFQLLPEVLVRLGMSSGAGVTAQVRSRLPKPVRSLVRTLLPGQARRRLQAAAGSLPKPLESPDTRCVDLPNNHCGALRLNLAGREPVGRVQPGVEEEGLLEELRGELFALQDPASGEAIVERITTASEAFGDDYHPDIPDLMVRFRTDLGVIEDCRSPRVGLLHEPLYNANIPRTGDHTTESRLWLTGAEVDASRLTEGSVLDIAPTVLEALGVPGETDLDGNSLLRVPGTHA
jgi:predicted AlkP superfamily phosphohydrolase/phosphomutase